MRRDDTAIPVNDTSAIPGGILDAFHQLGLVGLAISAPDQRWLEINDRLCEILGYTREQLTQMTWADVTHPDDRNAENAELERLLDGSSEHITIDKRFVTRSGRSVYVTVATMCVRHSDGSVNYLISHVLDTTEHKHNERVLSTRVRLVEMAGRMSSTELLQAFLDEAEALTESRSGFFHFLADDEDTVHLQIWSSNTRNQMYSLSPDKLHYPIAQAGAWVDCVHSRRPVIHNNAHQLPGFQGISDGHAPLKRELVVPVFRNDKIVAVLGVGNKATAYHDDDVKVINDLADLAWDIVSRKRVEESLRASEKRFRGTFEQAAVGVALVSPDGRYLRINQRACEIFGYSQDELLRMRFSDVTHPDDVEEDLEQTQRILHGEIEQFRLEKRYIRKDGSVVWGHIHVSLVRDQDGQPDYFISVVQDITSRKQAEDALRRSEERFRNVADFTYDWEFWTSIDGEMSYVSPSCQRITGYTRDAFMSDPDLLTRILHPDDRERIIEHLTRESKEIGLRNENFRIVRRDGQERWIEHVCQPVYGPDGRFRGRRASNRDITDRIVAEQERKNLQLQLIQAQKMEAVGTLAAGVAHDFNNALTAIIGHAELARLEVSRGIASTQNIDGIMAAAKRAAGIARSMLTFSRGTPTNKVAVNLAQFLNESTGMLQRIVPAIVDMRIEAPINDNHWVIADTVHLNQIVLNLVVNARDAMPEGGQLDLNVSWQSLESGDDWPLVLDRERGVVVLTVADTGTGMTEEVMARVCDPFFTTKPREQGTGLGMSIVHGIVENHGGQLKLESSLGHGTRVAIAFPAAERAEIQQRTVLPVAGEHRVAATVLVADDNEQVRRILAAAFEDVGCGVIQASNGADALLTFDRYSQKVDLVVLDVDMPKIRGTKCLAHIRDVRPDLPAILISGFHEYNPSEIEQDNVHFLRKPFQMQEVTELASALLDSAGSQAH